MSISQIAIRRIAENRAIEDETYRLALERPNRPLTWHVRRMSDEELVAKLHSLNISMDPARLDELSRRYPAAYVLAGALIDEREFDEGDFADDWTWFAVEALWQRWFPGRPNMEMVDDRMQTGYAAAKRYDSAEACRHWKQAWLAILDLMRRFRIESIAAFDECFGGTQSVFSWLQDYETELCSAACDDASFIEERIGLCKTVIERFDESQLAAEKFRRALAESYLELDRRETGDQSLRQRPDIEHADHIASPNLMSQLRDDGPVVPQADHIVSQNDALPMGLGYKAWEEAAIGQRQRIGRNTPCPCGSGKKFKKCCARRD